MPIKDKFTRRPEQLVSFTRATGGEAWSTSVPLATAIGATSVVVAVATGITPGQSAQLDGGEDIERVDVLSVTGTTVTLARPTMREHAAGAVLIGQRCDDIGDTDGDVTVAMSKSNTDQFSTMRFLPFGKLAGFADGSLAFRVQGVTLENMALALGIPLAKVVGTGANLANPKTLSTDFTDVDTVQDQCLAMVVRRQDGSRTVIEAWGVACDYTQVAVQLARGNPGTIPARYAIIGALAQFDEAPVWIASQSVRASKAKLFKALTRVSALAPVAGGPTTVRTATAANAATLPVVSSANIAAHDWVLIGTDDRIEVHQVLSKVSDAITLKSPLLRAQAVGVRVVSAVRIPYGAVVEGGTTFTVGGTTSPIRTEFRELPVAMQAQNAAASLTFSDLQLDLAAIVRSLAKPASSVLAGRTVLSDALLEAQVDAILVEGVTADNSVCAIVLWGCTQDLANWSLTFGSSTPTQLPSSFAPTSGVHFMQYAA
jgi:hypothetical protein